MANTKIKSLKLSTEEWSAIEAAAEAARMSPHAWIRTVVNAALGISDLPRHLRRVEPAWIPGKEITGRNIKIPNCDECGTLKEIDFTPGAKLWFCPACEAPDDPREKTNPGEAG